MKKFIPAILVVLLFAWIILSDSSEFSSTSRIALSEDFTFPADGPLPFEPLAADETVTEWIPNTGKAVHILYLCEGSVVYLLENDDGATLMQNCFAEEAATPVADLAFYRMSTHPRTVAETGGMLYFYTHGPGKLAVDVFGFYALDLSEQILTGSICTAPPAEIVPQVSANGKLYSLKGNAPLIGSRMTSYVEEYDPVSGQQRKVQKTFFHRKRVSGEEFLHILQHDGQFLLLVAVYGDEITYRLDFFDASWHKTDSVSVDLPFSPEEILSCEVVGARLFCSGKDCDTGERLLLAFDLSGNAIPTNLPTEATLSSLGQGTPSTRLALDLSESTAESDRLWKFSEDGTTELIRWNPLGKAYRCCAVYQCAEQAILEYEHLESGHVRYLRARTAP